MLDFHWLFGDVVNSSRVPFGVRGHMVLVSETSLGQPGRRRQVVLCLLPASKAASAWHPAWKWLYRPPWERREWWAGVGSIDLHSRSPLSSERLLESQMVSIAAGKKKKKKKTQKNTTHAYRKVISKGETTDFLNKSHKKDSCSLYEALTTCDFAIFNLIIIHHFLKGAQLGSVWVCRVGVCVCKSVCVWECLTYMYTYCLHSLAF